jgi:hypothetical protein
VTGGKRTADFGPITEDEIKQVMRFLCHPQDREMETPVSKERLEQWATVRRLRDSGLTWKETYARAPVVHKLVDSGLTWKEACAKASAESVGERDSSEEEKFRQGYMKVENENLLPPRLRRKNMPEQG